MQEPFVPSINMVKNRTDILGIQGFSRFEIPTKYQSFKSITIQLPLRRFLDIPLSTLITNTMQSTYILFQHQNMLPIKVLFPLPLLVPQFSLKIIDQKTYTHTSNPHRKLHILKIGRCVRVIQRGVKPPP